MRGGDFILMARRRAGLTQRELGERVDCRQATIARWERGDRQPSFEDAQSAAAACGLELDAHLVTEDRSWWPQVATQLELDPLERISRLTPPGSVDLVEGLRLLAAADPPSIVIGEIAGALHGWPLVLNTDTIEICGRAEDVTAALPQVASKAGDPAYRIPRGGRVVVTESPPGTAGFGDLARGAELVAIEQAELRVASLLDLLRMADAAPDRDGRRHALALRSVLDVRRSRQHVQSQDLGDDGQIAAWVAKQTPVG